MPSDAPGASVPEVAANPSQLAQSLTIGEQPAGGPQRIQRVRLAAPPLPPTGPSASHSLPEPVTRARPAPKESQPSTAKAGAPNDSFPARSSPWSSSLTGKPAPSSRRPNDQGPHEAVGLGVRARELEVGPDGGKRREQREVGVREDEGRASRSGARRVLRRRQSQRGGRSRPAVAVPRNVLCVAASQWQESHGRVN
jgi:hypothetical protein